MGNLCGTRVQNEEEDYERAKKPKESTPMIQRKRRKVKKKNGMTPSYNSFNDNLLSTSTKTPQPATDPKRKNSKHSRTKPLQNGVKKSINYDPIIHEKTKKTVEARSVDTESPVSRASPKISEEDHMIMKELFGSKQSPSSSGLTPSKPSESVEAITSEIQTRQVETEDDIEKYTEMMADKLIESHPGDKKINEPIDTSPKKMNKKRRKRRKKKERIETKPNWEVTKSNQPLQHKNISKIKNKGSDSSSEYNSLDHMSKEDEMILSEIFGEEEKEKTKEAFLQNTEFSEQQQQHPKKEEISSTNGTNSGNSSGYNSVDHMSQEDKDLLTEIFSSPVITNPNQDFISDISENEEEEEEEDEDVTIKQQNTAKNNFVLGLKQQDQDTEITVMTEFDPDKMSVEDDEVLSKIFRFQTKELKVDVDSPSLSMVEGDEEDFEEGPSETSVSEISTAVFETEEFKKNGDDALPALPKSDDNISEQPLSQKKTKDAAIKSPRRKRRRKNSRRKSNNSFKKENLKIGDAISSGAFGIVKKGVYFDSLKNEEIAVAIKEMKILNSKEYDSIRHEIAIQEALSHPNVLSCIGHFFDGAKAYVILEYCSKGDLFHYKSRIVNKHRSKLKILYSIAKGMRYLHDRNIIHRDLKPQNVLIGKKKRIKICDFGTSKRLNSFKQSFVGTVEYIASEIIFASVSNNNEKITSDPKLIDVYAFGIIIWELWTAKHPFHQLKKKIPSPYPFLREVHLNKRRPDLNDPMIVNFMHPDLKKLMCRCWDSDASKRPFFKEIEKKLKRIIRASPKEEE